MRKLCLFLMIGGFIISATGTVATAADSDNNSGQNIAAITQHANGTKNLQMQKWLQNIKPAAGVKQTMSINNESHYWEKTVARSRRHVQR